MKKGACGWALTIAGFSVLVAQARVINVDFQPGVTGELSSSNYVGQGAYADVGNDVWNHVAVGNDGAFSGTFGSGGVLNFAGDAVTSAALLDSVGVATPVTVTVRKGDPEACFAVAYTNASIVNIATNAQGLMSDYLIAQDDVATVVISNLANGGLYSLLCYGAGDLDFRNTTFIVGDAAKTTTGVPGGPHGLAEGQDYVSFTGVVALDGAITITYLNGGESTDGNFNGFQLIEAEPVSVSTVRVGAVTGLSFASVSGATYRLQYTSDLLSTNWQTAPMALFGTGGTMNAFDPDGFSTQKLYRIFQE